MLHPLVCHNSHENCFSTLQNLLQSETEGIDDEKIGFYGRCMLHAIEPRYLSMYDPIHEMGSQEEKEFTCARVEVFSSFIAFLGLISSRVMWGTIFRAKVFWNTDI